MDNILFYYELPEFNGTLTQLLSKESHFKTVPDDWFVVVVDVEKSTQAVKHKLHHPVNYASTHSIIAVLNELQSINHLIDIPYFFGGDGATFLIPEENTQRVLLILENVKSHIYESHFLALRVGAIQVSELKAIENVDIPLAKLRLTDNLVVPVSHGNGLDIAERLIKDKLAKGKGKPRQDMYVNFEGCECRWDNLKPKKSDDKVLCFIAQPKKNESSLKTLHNISQAMDECFGDYLKRHPVNIEGLKQLDSTYNIHTEWNSIYEESSFTEQLQLSLGSLSKNLYDATMVAEKFREYLRKCSLALLIDGSYNDIVVGSEAQIQHFIDKFEKLESQGDLIFGYHITDSAVLSCYLAEPNGQFVQLVDANEGGYSTASKMLKIKAKVSL